MKRDLKKVYNGLTELCAACRKADDTLLFYADTFISDTIKTKFENNDIPFNDLEFFNDLFIKYLAQVFDNKFLFNYNFFKHDFNNIEEFYKKYNDNEDVIKNKSLKNLATLSVMLESNDFIKPLYYMNVNNLNIVFNLTEHLIIKFNDYENITKDIKEIFINYLNYIISIRLYIKDDNSYLIYCINLLDEIIFKINENYEIKAKDINFNEIKNKLYNSKFMSKNILSYFSIFHKKNIDFNEKIDALLELLCDMDKSLDKDKYLEELTEIRNKEVNLDNIDNLTNYYNFNKTNDINNIKNREYNNLFNLIKDNENVFIIEEEGSRAEETLKQIEKDLDIEIIKQNLKDFSDIFYEKSNYYKVFMDAYTNGKKLCLICDYKHNLIDKIGLSSSLLIEPSCKFVRFPGDYGVELKKHPDFQLIIIYKDANISNYERATSKANVSLIELTNIKTNNFKKILFENDDYPLLKYLSKNNNELYIFIVYSNRNICDIDNNKIIKFIKYEESGLYDLEELFNILFSDEILMTLNVNYLIENILNDNKYLKSLTDYVMVLKGLMPNCKKMVKKRKI